MMSSIIHKKNSKKIEKKVQFAEHDDVFVLPIKDDDVSAVLSDFHADADSLGLDTAATAAAAAAAAAEVEDEDEGEDEASDGDSDFEEEEEDETDVGSDIEDETEAEDDCSETEEQDHSFGDVFLRNQSRMRSAIHYWTYTPYTELLKDAVQEEGEAEGVQKYITTFVRIEENGDCPRGLERQICHKHNEARKNLIENAMHTVLLNDFRLRYETKNLTEDEIWKELRNISKKLSKGSQAFARKMGKADESAVQRGPIDKEVALEQLEEHKERRKNGISATTRRSSNGTADSSSPDSKKKSKAKSSSSSSEHLTRRTSSSSSSKKDKKDNERNTPKRVPSMALKRSYLPGSMASSSTRDKKSSKDSSLKKHSDKKVAGVDLLFHDVDKRGKTKTSSRWKSLKKRLSSSASSQNKRSQ